MQIILPTFVGEYAYCSLALEEYERRSLENIPKTIRKMEAECIQKRWFDYVRLHPLQASYWFVECYRRIYKELSKKYKDINYTEGVRADFLESREKNAFLRCRQFCDLNGMEYSWFIRTMMEYRLESGEFKNYLPRPQHLLKASDDEIETVKEAWRQRTSGEVLMTSVDPWFKVGRWEGHPRQIAHEDFLVEQIRHKRVKHFALSDLIYKRQVLRFERAVAEHPDEVRDVIRDASYM